MLVDASVWMNHFRRPNMDLEQLLDEGLVVTHPFVIGKLACLSLRGREEVLRLMEALPSAPIATHEEVMVFMEREDLAGSGLTWTGMHLLASARLGRQSLWSADRRLREAAVRLGLADEE